MTEGVGALKFTLLACLLLASACSNQSDLQKSGTMDEVAKHDASIVDLQDRVRRIEERDDQQDNAITAANNYTDAVANGGESLRKTFNRNVDQENRVKALRATTQGYCGQETYVDDYGVTRLRNRECKVSDLP